jgi:pilus assembly protein CpaF
MIDLVAEQSPFGGLERWLRDPTVTEVMVNAGRDIWVERQGHLQHVGHMRTSTVLAVIEHVLAPTGRRLDRSHPTVDARLPDGSRLCAVIEPVAVDGPCMAIRRFAAQPVPLTEFAAAPVVGVLEQLVRARCNVVVSGATSSGKTTLLNALAQLVEPHCRVITLEDVAELRLRHPHVLRFETREATPDGVGEIALEHLLRAALRMRPDRLVVGEVRGVEAVHLLQALNTGHDGSLCTVHANSAADALARLASLVVQHAGGWPLVAVHHHVSRAVDAVVHVARSADGRRHVAEVAEVAAPNDTSPALAVRALVRDGHVVGTLTRRRA